MATRASVFVNNDVTAAAKPYFSAEDTLDFVFNTESIEIAYRLRKDG